MGAQLFISLLNPGIGFLLAVAFLILWSYQRERPYIAIAALSYAASGLGFFIQDVIPPWPLHLERLASSACYLMTGALMAVAVIKRYNARPPYIWLGLIFSVGILGTSWYLLVDPSLAGRIFFTSSAISVMAGLIALRLSSVPDKQLVDILLLTAAILTCLTFFLRPVVVAGLNNGFGNPDDLYQSIYWTSVQFSQAMVSIVFALNLMVAVALDRFADLRLEATTDPLSGLRNRRGFEADAVEALKLCQREGLPACLLIADLDHFKRINDTYGHATGDKVIRLFGKHLRHLSHDGIISGRIGGEEFAVLLPGTDLPAARLFAETLRAGLSHISQGIVPADLIPTTSIGVCRAEPGRSLFAVLNNADEALYEAKRAGRNSVKTYEADSQEMPAIPELISVNSRVG